MPETWRAGQVQRGREGRGMDCWRTGGIAEPGGDQDPPFHTVPSLTFLSFLSLSSCLSCNPLPLLDEAQLC